MNTLLILLAIGAITLIAIGTLQVLRGPKQEPSPTDGLPASDFPEGWDRVAARKRIRRKQLIEATWEHLALLVFLCANAPLVTWYLLKGLVRFFVAH